MGVEANRNRCHAIALLYHVLLFCASLSQTVFIQRNDQRPVYLPNLLSPFLAIVSNQKKSFFSSLLLCFNCFNAFFVCWDCVLLLIADDLRQMIRPDELASLNIGNTAVNISITIFRDYLALCPKNLSALPANHTCNNHTYSTIDGEQFDDLFHPSIYQSINQSTNY
jgi:hypothetical protein